MVDVGDDGCFDDNGVFPGHAYKFSEKSFFILYRISNFGQNSFLKFFSGLAISDDGGNTFRKFSKAPILDRADEGLYTRAGLSMIHHNNKFKCCYSTGSSWQKIADKKRPVYEVRITH